MRSGNITSIAGIATEMASAIREPCTIIPVLNFGGFADNTLLLAHAILDRWQWSYCTVCRQITTHS